MSNLVTALAKGVERYPHQVAVQGGDRSLTLAELGELSARVAGGLLAHGVRPGDRVEMRLPYGLAFAVLCFGALRTGAIVVPLRPMFPSLAGQRGGNAFGARLVFISPDTQVAQEAGTGETMLIPVGPDFLSQLAFWPNHSAVVARADDDPAVLLRTGASAGVAWDTVLSQRAVHAGSLNVRVQKRSLADHRAYGLRAVLLSGSCPPLSEHEQNASAVSRSGGEAPAVTRRSLKPATRR